MAATINASRHLTTYFYLLGSLYLHDKKYKANKWCHLTLLILVLKRATSKKNARRRGPGEEKYSEISTVGK